MKRRRAHGLAKLAFGALLAAWGCAAGSKIPGSAARPHSGQSRRSESAYAEEILSWREARRLALTAPDGWLSLAGLHWLREGANTFGSDPANDFVVTQGHAPAHIGAFLLTAGRVRMEIHPGISVLHNGVPVQSIDLIADVSDDPTVLRLGTMSWHLIERGPGIGVRVRDSRAVARTKFTGIESFPIDPAWRVEAIFDPYDPPRELAVPTVLGTVSTQTCPGALLFTVNGRRCRLDAITYPGDPRLFIVFADQTSGHESYGGGRFIYVDPPDAAGRTIVDFNKAHNPPCAFTPYATCPLPPPQNRLPIRITAGEKRDTAGRH